MQESPSVENTPLGIDETKDVLKFGLKLGKALGKSLEDGDWDWTDVVNFVEPAMAIPDAIEGFDKVDDEILDIDDTEQAELEAIVTEFDIPQDRAEEIVERAFKFGMAGIRLYQALK